MSLAIDIIMVGIDMDLKTFFVKDNTNTTTSSYHKTLLCQISLLTKVTKILIPRLVAASSFLPSLVLSLNINVAFKVFLVGLDSFSTLPPPPGNILTVTGGLKIVQNGKKKLG